MRLFSKIEEEKSFVFMRRLGFTYFRRGRFEKKNNSSICELG